MEILTERIDGNRFSIWPESDDKEFVWVYSKEDEAHITGNIGPLKLKKYPELEATDRYGIDAACIRVVGEILSYSHDPIRDALGKGESSPDSFPVLKYFPEFTEAVVVGLLSRDMWELWNSEHREILRKYTFFDVFFNYLKHFGIEPCVYVTECCLPQPDLFVKEVPHLSMGTRGILIDVSNGEIKRYGRSDRDSWARKCGIDYVIEIKHDDSEEEKRLTLAHELGHILLKYITGEP